MRANTITLLSGLVHKIKTCSFHLYQYANSSEYPDHHSVLQGSVETHLIALIEMDVYTESSPGGG